MNPITPTVSILEYEHAADAGRMLQHFCHGAGKAAGQWKSAKTGSLNDETALLAQAKLLAIAHNLYHTGNSLKKQEMTDELPHRTSAEVFLARSVIRIADVAGALGFDLGLTIAEVLAFNANAQNSGGSNV